MFHSAGALDVLYKLNCYHTVTPLELSNEKCDEEQEPHYGISMITNR